MENERLLGQGPEIGETLIHFTASEDNAIRKPVKEENNNTLGRA
jgi:hypothetical protein